ncbi:hypothetical protein EVJ27_11685 [Exiguobacterium sp. SH3S2]|uniref:hypothetical protein n=1 Tax=unclassified Exiguobacterium TaxID=2644629 RepID=UPI0010404684|nr:MULTISPECIES: hypothetical protein [unclassified Exiguobacterium]TCI42899.1 hypothetical protein EVJ28_11705 [Exiguobacterium sp. SH3S3]TCI58652.1 hypothetical protein EVJ27_11685 [Exiguobacterium sp. SH3S2]
MGREVMVEHTNRLLQLMRLEQVSIRLFGLLVAVIILSSFYLHSRHTLTNVQVFAAFLFVYAVLLLWGWVRMKLLLRFNSNETYQRYVQLEFLGVFLTIVGLTIFIWNGVIQVNQSITYSWLGTLIILPYIYVASWVDRRLKEVDAEHVTHQELRKQRRLK